MNDAKVQARVDLRLRQYGTSIVIRPWQAGPVDLYRQSEGTYGADITCTGRAIRNATSEMLTVIGKDEFFDLACVFSYTEMVAKFPAATVGKFVSTRDRVVFDGNLYAIQKATSTGRIQGYDHLFVLACRTLEGRRAEAP